MTVPSPKKIILYAFVAVTNKSTVRLLLWFAAPGYTSNPRESNISSTDALSV
jgi:hypothetical protein